MDDNSLERFLPAIGDRVALRNYCGGNSNYEKQSRKLNLLEKLRKKMKLGHASNISEDTSEETGSGTRGKLLIGNKNACKNRRRIEIGWLHNGKQVRARCGGGTRKVTVQKTMCCDDLINLGKELFFPKGQSKKGPEANFSFKIYDFQECEMSHDITVGELYESAKLGVLRFYLATFELEESDASEDTHSSDTPSEQKDDCYITGETYFSSDDEIHFGPMPMESPNYTSDDTLPIGSSQEEIPSTSQEERPSMSQEEMPSTSREVSHLITHQESAPKVLRLCRVNIVHDMVEKFKDASVVEANL
ncbi:uncharacterized protein LOC130562169 [Triplophysa rosa]|uniref:uncharacterized protein LOC130562169 n=1 Tax=Triplophysa rosa TaxID=992332 RepID=UPI0025460B7D|nr:uncharacterized protein LOC130562169 [Triplophysa rosa]